MWTTPLVLTPEQRGRRRRSMVLWSAVLVGVFAILAGLEIPSRS